MTPLSCSPLSSLLLFLLSSAGVICCSLFLSAVKTQPQRALKIAQGKQSIIENTTAYGFCQCFRFIVIPLSRGGGVFLSALHYIMLCSLSISRLTPTGGRPAGLLLSKVTATVMIYFELLQLGHESLRFEVYVNVGNIFILSSSSSLFSCCSLDFSFFFVSAGTISP